MSFSEDLRRFRWATLLAILGFVLLFELAFSNFGLPIRFFTDNYDRSDYFHIGNWSLTGQVPYVDTVSEYPQVPVYFFGLLNRVSASVLPASFPAGVGFMILWYVCMGACLWVAMGLLWQLLPVGRKWLAWLMMLPAGIYFAMNRFDILPVMISLLAVNALKQNRTVLSSALLTVGIFTKWYLAFFVPPFLLFEWWTSRKFPWKSILVLALTGGLLVLPTWLMGGWNALVQPYAWHLQRPAEPGTLLWMIGHGISLQENRWSDPSFWMTLFTILGFSGFVVPFLVKTDSIRKVILASILSLIPFLVFNRIFSPQWWLWMLPLLILTSRDWIDVLLIVVYDLLDYLAFPVLYDGLGNLSMVYLLCTGALIALLLILFWRTSLKLSKEKGMISA